MELVTTLSEADVLARVTVRLIEPAERAACDRLLREEHYLKSSALVGEALRYVAELDGQWLALAAFSAPALQLKGRERWIGWSSRPRARRLPLVVSNRRFLVRPERRRLPNLASRVLGGVSAPVERGLAGTLGASGARGREFRR